MLCTHAVYVVLQGCDTHHTHVYQHPTSAKPSQHALSTNRMEWMRHPLADTWFFEVTDTCAFGGMWDGNGGDMKGWSAAHLAMLQTRSIIWNELRCVLRCERDVLRCVCSGCVRSTCDGTGIVFVCAYTLHLYIHTSPIQQHHPYVLKSSPTHILTSAHPHILTSPHPHPQASQAQVKYQCSQGFRKCIDGKS